MSNALVRQHYHQQCEAVINRQISLKLSASYVFSGMAFKFELPGFRNFFFNLSAKEYEHAKKLMKYQNSRGGRIVFHDIPGPSSDCWVSGLEAMEASLQLEKKMNEAFIESYNIAAVNADANMRNFIASHFLEYQQCCLKLLSNYVVILKQLGPGLGETIFDKKNLQD